MNTKIKYALCNGDKKPVLLFNNIGSLQAWMENQKAKHGHYPVVKPYKITTTVEMEEMQWPMELQ